MSVLPWSLACLAVFCAFSLCWYRLRSLERTVIRLEDRSTRDYQTGLRAGRLYDEDAAILCRSNCRIAVLLVDLDNFRAYNRVGYREGGDAALCSASRALERSFCRQSDRLYRLYAGDEFLILLTVGDAAEAHAHAERCRRALAAVKVPGSVGIAFADPDAADTERHNRRTPARLLALATSNKEAAKQRGGNQVFPPLQPPNDPPSVVASVALPAPLDWEKTERIVIGDPLPKGAA